jgi:hypothetical protein
MEWADAFLAREQRRRNRIAELRWRLLILLLWETI